MNQKMCTYVFVAFVFCIACVPSRDPTALIDGRSVDGSITVKEAMRELDRNSVDPIMVYDKKLVVYVASNGKTNRYFVSGSRNDIERFLKKAEVKRVPIHIVQENTIKGYLGMAVVVLVVLAVLGFIYFGYEKKNIYL